MRNDMPDDVGWMLMWHDQISFYVNSHADKLFGKRKRVG
jgi:hypothetical protein